MELIERSGGLGKIAVEGTELESLKQLLALTEGYRQVDALRCEGFLGEDDRAKAEFKNLMEELFPAFSLQRRPNGTYEIVSSVQPAVYNKIKFDSSRRIPSRLPIARAGMDNVVELEILVPSVQEERSSSKDSSNSKDSSCYFMAVALSPSYKPDAADDLVQILGSRETPPLTAAAPIVYGDVRELYCRSTVQFFGLADVPRLKEAIELYGKASRLIENSEEAMGLSKQQLNVLRRDSIEHENVFVRKGSKRMYQQALEELTNR